MRPPEFTGGNKLAGALSKAQGKLASMRPPEFTGGNRRTDKKAMTEITWLQ